MNTTFANHDNAELGLVLVSTGVQKFGKPSAGRGLRACSPFVPKGFRNQ